MKYTKKLSFKFIHISQLTDNQTHTHHIKSRLPQNYSLYMYIIFLYQKAMPLRKAQTTISEAQDMTVFCTQFALFHKWQTYRWGDAFDDMYNIMQTKSREWSQSTMNWCSVSVTLRVSFPIISKKLTTLLIMVRSITLGLLT